MSYYILRRFFSLLVTLILASIIIFSVIEIIPGDAASTMMGIDASEEAIEALREELGLNRSAIARYLSWVGGMIQGDFGISYAYRSPVADLLVDRIAVSIPLALFALLLAILLGFPAGILAASKRNSWVDFGVMGASQFGIAVPNFWFAMMLVYIFSISLRWFSSGGFPGWDEGFWISMKALLLPAIALALPQASILARVSRSSLLDTLGEDYIRTARAKGHSARGALRHHALRNALIPVLTIIGLQFSYLLAGAIIIENVFYLPGLGRLVFQAIGQRDLIVVESVVMILVFAVILINFLVDLSYLIVDPRLRRVI